MTKIGNKNLESVKIEVQDSDDLATNKYINSHGVCSAYASRKEALGTSDHEALEEHSLCERRLFTHVNKFFSTILLVTTIAASTGLVSQFPLNHISASLSATSCALIMFSNSLDFYGFFVPQNVTSPQSCLNYKVSWCKACVPLITGTAAAAMFANDIIYREPHDNHRLRSNSFYSFAMCFLLTILGIVVLSSAFFNLHSAIRCIKNKIMASKHTDTTQVSTGCNDKGSDFSLSPVYGIASTRLESNVYSTTLSNKEETTVYMPSL